MAVVSYLVSRSDRAGDTVLNNLHGMLLAIDNAVDTSDALILARAVTVANAQGHPLPAGYFDTLQPFTGFDVAGEYVIVSRLLKVGVS